MDQAETIAADDQAPASDTKAAKKRTMVIRLPVTLHASLKAYCEGTKTSMNQHCVDVLTASVQTTRD